ncbi:hypothetical protein CBD41_05280 [bacterium TMED181]|nr:hypothetical protein [Planctomycetota bacterium]OUW44703.1 MAG: hypothetical protein CBD41_05280 [bacterium TMED181]
MKKLLLALVVVGGLSTAGCIFAPQGGEEKSECAASACATSCADKAAECGSEKDSCCGSCK